jgi:hypothetical protein
MLLTLAMLLALTACDTCDTVFAVASNLDGEVCADLADPAVCCPADYKWVGYDADTQILCWSETCETTYAVVSVWDGLVCDADSGCCPEGYDAVGRDADGALVCVGG